MAYPVVQFIQLWYIFKNKGHPNWLVPKNQTQPFSLFIALAVFWLTFALTIDGGMAAGYNVNALELSPNYAGSIRGMASTIANIQGFLAPTIISLIIEDNVGLYL